MEALGRMQVSRLGSMACPWKKSGTGWATHGAVVGFGDGKGNFQWPMLPGGGMGVHPKKA